MAFIFESTKMQNLLFKDGYVSFLGFFRWPLDFGGFVKECGCVTWGYGWTAKETFEIICWVIFTRPTIHGSFAK